MRKLLTTVFLMMTVSNGASANVECEFFKVDSTGKTKVLRGGDGELIRNEQAAVYAIDPNVETAIRVTKESEIKANMFGVIIYPTSRGIYIGGGELRKFEQESKLDVVSHVNGLPRSDGTGLQFTYKNIFIQCF